MPRRTPSNGVMRHGIVAGGRLKLDHYKEALKNTDPIQTYGKVSRVVGLVVEASGPVANIGCLCDIHTRQGTRPIQSEILGFKENSVLLMPLEEFRGIAPGDRVTVQRDNAYVPVGDGLLGRIVDGMGHPMDGGEAIVCEKEYLIYAPPVNPLSRRRITQPLDLGVKAINGLLTVGRGQRMGIFSGSGVGKSVLLGMIARYTDADVNVIALIGERGREVNEFIEKELGAEGLKKSVVLVATSDQHPLIRTRGAFIATAIAEFFRDQGKCVNLMMDSVTRFAMAQREIGLALGEPPANKGYTPSVFTTLSRLLERAGTHNRRGIITGLYTVLVEGDDFNEPVADAVRAILDGHIILTRDLAVQSHYPAIDVLQSISRVMNDIAEPGHRQCANRLKKVLSLYRKNEDLINIGAYTPGSNSQIDDAIEKYPAINQYLTQEIHEKVSLDQSREQLEAIFQ